MAAEFHNTDPKNLLDLPYYQRKAALEVQQRAVNAGIGGKLLSLLIQNALTRVGLRQTKDDLKAATEKIFPKTTISL